MRLRLVAEPDDRLADEHAPSGAWTERGGRSRGRETASQLPEIRLRLSDGIVFVVHADFAEFCEAFQEALRSRALIAIDNATGKRRFINPGQILYAEAKT